MGNILEAAAWKFDVCFVVRKEKLQSRVIVVPFTETLSCNEKKKRHKEDKMRGITRK